MGRQSVQGEEYTSQSSNIYPLLIHRTVTIIKIKEFAMAVELDIA